MTGPIKVGDNVYFADRWEIEPHKTVVEKVGTRYITTKGGCRWFKDSLKSANGMGKLYTSPEHYAAEKEAQAAWLTFKNRVPFYKPPTVTIETIRTVTRMLGLPE